MKTTLALLLVVLVISFTAYTAFARNLPKVTAANINDYKTMLQGYFHPSMNGYGIGFNNDKYIVAKWHITNVRILPFSDIKSLISNSNSTSWSELKDEIQKAIQTEGKIIQEGRMMIGNITYILTNIKTSNTTSSADIRRMPDYTVCKQQNISSEDCENNTEKVGSISVTKKTNAIEDAKDNNKIWAGILSFMNVDYTFVAFAYPG